MSHVSIKRSESIDDLFYAILSLQNIDECYALFSDMFTIQELTAFAQRLQVARMLMQGSTYKMVRNNISISTSTITRINTEFNYGSGGYRMVLERLPEIRQKLESASKIERELSEPAEGTLCDGVSRKEEPVEAKTSSFTKG